VRKLLLLQSLVLSILYPAISQERCASMYMDSLRRVEQGTESLHDFENWLQALMAKNSHNIHYNGSRAVVTIPVVVHVIHNGDAVGVGENISAAQINSQIDVLNEDFRKMMGTPGHNTNPIGADVEIEWCMALIDPNGNIMTEPGIDRVNLGTASYSSTSTINSSVKPQTYWDPERYCNVWTVNFSGSVLGYAQFPNVSLQGIGTNNGGASTDGVVIRHTAFGRVGNVQSPYNKGRTLTHELGHWLGLRHIWGDGSSCSATDYCDDTPKATAANYGCPTKNSCNDGTPDSNDMVQNYMDYTDDGCMNIFTLCQKTRMLTALNNAPRRAGLLNSNACTIPVTFSYTGKVVDASTNIGVANALVFLDGKTDYHVTTDTNGFYTVANLQQDVYFIYAGKWGFVTNVVNNLSLQQGSPQTTVLINPGYYDDFLLNFNWTESGNAVSGKWLRGNPVGTTYTASNVTYKVNVDVDVTGDFGSQCFVSGNGGGQAGTDDVDDGTTILTSPVFDLTTYNEPILSYYRWFYNGGGSGNPDDSLIVSITNGMQTVVLERNSVSTASLSQWLFKSYRLNDYIAPSNNMRLIVRTFDSSTGHLVEGGFDLFRIKDSTSIANVPPIVNFSASKTVVCVNDTISFSNLSLNDPDTLLWSFPGGNPSSSTEVFPKVTYSTPGVYNVSLIGINEAGRDTVEFEDFVVVRPVVAEFESNSQTGCAGLQVEYTQSALCNADSFEWFFDGGVPSSSILQNPTVTYPTAGFFDVILIVKNQFGADTVTKNLYAQVLAPPVVVATATDNINFSIHGTVTANVTGGIAPFTYTWDDAGNQTSQTAAGLSPGIYSVTVADANGCTAVAADTVHLVQNTLIKDVESNLLITVAPNPFNYSFELDLHADVMAQMELRNHIGQEIIARKVIIGKSKIELHDHAPGIYYLHLQVNDKRYVIKLLKI
jgi:PKD repeat protein